MKKINFEQIIIREKITSHGGGVEIDLTSLGYPNKAMTAYQNYLGGGMLGRVVSDCNCSDWKNIPKLQNISIQLREYYFNLTNPEEGWESQSFSQNQLLPVSAY